MCALGPFVARRCLGAQAAGLGDITADDAETRIRDTRRLSVETTLMAVTP